MTPKGTKSGNGTVGDNTYGFDAIRGTQADGEFFVVICPLRLIPKIFHGYIYELPPEQRSQRILNKPRIPVLTKYILDNPKEYIFSSLTASVDGMMQFQPAPHLGPDGKVGRLTIDMNAKLLLNDGQHRKHAIEEAIKENRDLRSQSISIVLFRDKGLKRSQQMFADLNKNAMKPTKSLNILFDHRDNFSQFIVKLTKNIDIFRNRVNYEKTTIGNRDKSAFTLNAVLDSTRRLLGRTKIRKLSEEEKVAAQEFWTALSNILPEWRNLIRETMSPKDLRNTFVNTNTNCLNSLGIVGRVMRETYGDRWLKKLTKLRDIDWSRDNPMWDGNLMQDGKLVRTTVGIEMGADAILKKCGVPIPAKKVRRK